MSFDEGAPASAAAPGIRVQKAPGFEQAPAPAPGTPDEATDRKEVITGTVNLTAGDPVVVAQTLVDRVDDLDGRVDQRTENPGAGDAEPHANLVIRIPAVDTDAFIDGLSDLGEITEVSTNRDDVTLQWQDLDARIAALRTSVDRLRDLMARAADTADLIAAEEALADRQGELDSLTGQRRYLDDQISLSTLTIEISSTEVKTGDDGPTNFWDGIVDGWNSLFDWLKGAVVFVGQALPWLAFFALLGAIVGAVVELIRRLRARRDTTAASEPRKTTARAPKSETSDAATSKSETSDAATSDVENPESASSDAEASDAETSDAATSDVETSDVAPEPAATGDTTAKKSPQAGGESTGSDGPTTGRD